jgi:hypothetical protein
MDKISFKVYKNDVNNEPVVKIEPIVEPPRISSNVMLPPLPPPSRFTPNLANPEKMLIAVFLCDL